jgi:hypothetical protein
LYIPHLIELFVLTAGSPAGFRLRSLIARSLGQPEDLSMLYSRYRICSLARELKIPGPATEAVVDKSTLITQLNSLPLPVVLKSDGSWGAEESLLPQIVKKQFVPSANSPRLQAFFAH